LLKNQPEIADCHALGEGILLQNELHKCANVLLKMFYTEIIV